MIRLQFAATVQDGEQVPPEVRQRAERAGKTVDELVQDELYAVMHEAGEAYVARNRGSFRVGLT